MPAAPLGRQLAELSAQLGQMCDTATTAMQHATTALLDGRGRLAEQVVAGDAEIDRLQTCVEDLAYEVMLLHAPVAGDLRTVVSAIRSAGDIERMGNLALHVAQAARRRYPGNAVPAEVRPSFTEMGQLAVRLGRKAAEVARTRNVLLAAQLDADDDAMDTLHERMFAVLMHPSWPHGVSAAVDVTLLARYHERFADHAVKIALQTVYAVTGTTPESLPL